MQREAARQPLRGWAVADVFVAKPLPAHRAETVPLFQTRFSKPVREMLSVMSPVEDYERGAPICADDQGSRFRNVADVL